MFFFLRKKKILLSCFFVLLGFCTLLGFGLLATLFHIEIGFGVFASFFKEKKKALLLFSGKGKLEICGLSITPVLVYLDVVSYKDKILEENLVKAGIYRWTNVNNEKILLGSASDLARRLQCYLSSNYMISSKGKSKIYSSLLKHGYSAFKLYILENGSKKRAYY